MSEFARELDLLAEAVGDGVLGTEEVPHRGMFWVDVAPAALIPAATLLRDHPECDYRMLSDLHANDHPYRDKRFDILYNLYSLSRNRRLFLRVRVGENEPVPTLYEVYPNANWCEREVYDLFGVSFEDHPRSPTHSPPR